MKFFDADLGWKKFGSGIPDPGWKKVGSGILDKHPGSATMSKKSSRQKKYAKYASLEVGSWCWGVSYHWFTSCKKRQTRSSYCRHEKCDDHHIDGSIPGGDHRWWPREASFVQGVRFRVSFFLLYLQEAVIWMDPHQAHQLFVADASWLRLICLHHLIAAHSRQCPSDSSKWGSGCATAWNFQNKNPTLCIWSEKIYWK